MFLISWFWESLKKKVGMDGPDIMFDLEFHVANVGIYSTSLKLHQVVHQIPEAIKIVRRRKKI